MRQEDLIAIANRDWDAIAGMGREVWSTLELTPFERLALGDAIRARVLAEHPDWPTEEQRREDFETHVRVSEAMRSVKPEDLAECLRALAASKAAAPPPHSENPET